MDEVYRAIANAGIETSLQALVEYCYEESRPGAREEEAQRMAFESVWRKLGEIEYQRELRDAAWELREV